MRVRAGSGRTPGYVATSASQRHELVVTLRILACVSSEMRHMRTVAAVTLLATVAACSTNVEGPSGDASAPPSGMATTSAEPRSHSAGTASSAVPPKSVPESANPVAQQMSECEHTSGAYRVSLPEGWWVNPEFRDDELGHVAACRFFAPQDYDLTSADRETPVPEGVALWMDFLDGGCVGYINPILESRDVTVDGYATRVEELAKGKQDTNPAFTYQYVVTLIPEADCENDGEYIYALTNRDLSGDYEENKAVLDQMMESIQVRD